jgi:hypothetical protein
VVPNGGTFVSAVRCFAVLRDAAIAREMLCAVCNSLCGRDVRECYVVWQGDKEMHAPCLLVHGLIEDRVGVAVDDVQKLAVLNHMPKRHML